MPWHNVELELDAARADELGDALLEAGAESVSVERPDAARVRLSALLLSHADPHALVAQAAAACGLGAPPEFTVARVEDDDWVRRSQAQFSPLEVGARLWLGASWHTPPADRARRVVRLDPGMAFGTGSHPSTRLVLQWLEAVLRGGERVLDYGCGSGILAIVALALGARQADAVDVDAQALEAAAANAHANHFSVRCFLPDEMPENQYDIVVANILAHPLIALAPRLAAVTAPGGHIALSGLLEEQAGEVAAAYEPWFRAQVSRHAEGWALVEGALR